MLLTMDRQAQPCGARRLAVSHAYAGMRARQLRVSLADAFPSFSGGGGLSALGIGSGAVDDRYLLVGRGDGEVMLVDLERPAARGPVARRPRQATRQAGRGDDLGLGLGLDHAGHSRKVSSAAWFAADAGLFVTGSSDKRALVWDTAAFVPVCAFAAGRAVHQVALSPVPGAPTARLVACATDDVDVRLCDMHTGAASQVLSGHKGPVMTAAWSPSEEHVLATGTSQCLLLRYMYSTVHSTLGCPQFETGP